MGLLAVRRAFLVILVAAISSGSARAFHGPAPTTRASLAAPLFSLPRSRQTARESAVIAEWEQLSELQRRIEDGVHYDHWPETTATTRNNQANAESESQARRGVFCGYKTTSQDYDRLRSADPDDATPLDDFVYNFF